VEVRTVTSGPDTVIQVVDDGPEVPTSERERIFSGDLRNGAPVTRPAAVGLSLTVGRHLARQMDGDIEYRRMDGQNVFELRLPSEQISFIPRRIPA
jgi:K+-sensing histidine kinase KdpD